MDYSKFEIQGKNRNKVAVLMAAFNGENYINDQVNSILAQREVDIDLYISIDLSSDSTLDIVKKISQNNDNVFILKYGMRYGSAAQNFFRLLRDVDFSRYNYVALSDQDDIWLSDKLFEAVRVLQEKSYDAYSSNAIAFWENGKQRLIKKSQPLKRWDYLFEAAGPGCSYVFSCRLAAEIKEFLVKNTSDMTSVSLHDWFIYAFSRSRSYKWVIDERSFIFYRQHEFNVIGANSGLKSFLHRLKLLRSGWYRSQTSVLIKLLEVEEKEIDCRSPISLLKNINSFRRKKSDTIFLAIMIMLRLY